MKFAPRRRAARASGRSRSRTAMPSGTAIEHRQDRQLEGLQHRAAQRRVVQQRVGRVVDPPAEREALPASCCDRPALNEKTPRSPPAASTTAGSRSSSPAGTGACATGCGSTRGSHARDVPSARSWRCSCLLHLASSSRAGSRSSGRARSPTGSGRATPPASRPPVASVCWLIRLPNIDVFVEAEQVVRVVVAEHRQRHDHDAGEDRLPRQRQRDAPERLRRRSPPRSRPASSRLSWIRSSEA